MNGHDEVEPALAVASFAPERRNLGPDGGSLAAQLAGSELVARALEAAVVLAGASGGSLLAPDGTVLASGGAGQGDPVELALTSVAGEALGRAVLRGPTRPIDAAVTGLLAAALERVETEDAVRTVLVARARDADQLAVLLAEAPIGLALFDLAGRFRLVNPALAAMHGVAVDDHLGRTVAEVLPGLPATAGDPFGRVLAGEAAVQVEVTGEIPVAAGTVRHWLESWFPVHDPDGRVVGVAVAVVEVTEQRRAADRLARLQAVTAALSRAVTADDVVDVVVTVGTEEPGASSAGLWLLDAGSDVLRLAGTSGIQADVAERFVTIPLDSDLPAAVAVRTGTAFFVGSRAERDDAWPAVADTPAGREAVAALPFVGEGRPIGCLALAFDEERTFGPDDRAFFASIADLCAQALQRGRLHDAERTANERLAFLAEASTLLGESLDLDATLEEVVRLALEVFGELCVLFLVDPAGRLRPAAMAHADPGKRAVLDALADNVPPLTSIVTDVVRSGRAVTVAGVPDDLVRDATDSPAHGDAAEALGVGPVTLVPLLARGRPIGLLVCARGKGTAPFDEDDVALAEELARRAAVAIDNARLFGEQTRVAAVLQASLLPPRLPDVPGVVFGARYHPTGEGVVAVGGDFYDVFPVADGVPADDPDATTWAIVVGDVVGSGPEAAATTAVVRDTARAVSPLLRDPAAVVAAVNRALVDGAHDERFCTMVYGHLRPTPSGAELHVVNAGHPPPLLLRADGTVEAVPARGMLVGQFRDHEAEAVPVSLVPGDRLVAFTDGVVEAHRVDDGAPGEPVELFGDARLRWVLEQSAGLAPSGVAAAVESAVLAFAEGRAGDDIAVLVVGIEPAGGSWNG